MLEDLADIRDFTQGISKEQFLASALVKKAVGMSLINIGEVSRELPSEVKARYPQIPWGSIAALRNRAAHGYRSLDPEIIWTIIKEDLETLEAAMRAEQGEKSPQ
jgi:uncharacterized protein with HEPN domain